MPAGSVEELKVAMEYLLSKSSAQLAAMGDVAYARVTERHAIDTETQKLAELFKGAAS